MDVKLRQFNELLPSIIESIGEADFVTIDLEFSGISRVGGVNPTQKGRKQSLEERYVQARDAAMKYQVLQFGLCTVKYDPDIDTYVCRPYTFGVNTVTHPNWNLDREFLVQASAMEFLAQCGLNFSELFISGIPYLSHDEERRVWVNEKRHREHNKDEINIDEQSVDFVEKFVAELQEWIDDPDPECDFFNITGPDEELNAYQRRIIHQVVRKRFPDLCTIGKGTFVQVMKADEEEAKLRDHERLQKIKKNIEDGIGLRYVIDALRTAQKPLVGHNLFQDLINLYHCFVGPLPPTLAEFTDCVRADFSSVFDTKYLATCEGECTSYASGLHTLCETFSTLRFPRTKIHSENVNAALATAAHNAGYDSLTTAKVFLSLATTYQNHLADGYGPEEARKRLMGFINSFGEKMAVDRVSLMPDLAGGVLETFRGRLRVNGTGEGVALL